MYVVIIFVAKVLLRKYSKDNSTAFIPAGLEMLVYKDFAIRDTKY